MAAEPGVFDGDDGELVELQFEPGIYSLATNRGAKGRYKESDFVRFDDGGLPSKIGGCVRLDSESFIGICRALFDWLTLDLYRYLSIGTHKKLYLWQGGTFNNITPYRTTGTYGNNPITTSNTSAVVAIAHTTHGLTVGTTVNITDATAVGGITISGDYTVTALGDHAGANTADYFRITHSSAATSTATGGGASVDYKYDINDGAEHAASGFGWGAGPYGMGTFGTARSVSATTLPPRTWSLDQWGEDLIACPRKDKIYVWDASVGTGTRAALITNAPAAVIVASVSQISRHLIAFGCTDTGGVFDPKNIRWCDVEDYTNWTPAITNEAGELRIGGRGEGIECVIRTRGEFLVLTDYDAWRFFYVQPPDVFAATSLGEACGVLSAKGGVDVSGMAVWWGRSNFWMYDGAVKVLPCEIHSLLFDDFNFEQRGKVYAFVNSLHNEVWWCFPRSGASECNAAAVWNYKLRKWYRVTYARTAGVDASNMANLPIMAGADSYLYSHENGVDNNGSAITAYIETYDAEIGTGKSVMRVRNLIPDFKELVGGGTLKIKARNYPTKTQKSVSRAITPTTTRVRGGIRGRQVALRFESSNLGDDWTMGNWRALVIEDGER